MGQAAHAGRPLPPGPRGVPILGVLPALRRDWRLDFVVVNAENATGGVGVSEAHAALLLEAGADCLTLGDHAFDQRDG